jgi:hypothetical protein
MKPMSATSLSVLLLTRRSLFGGARRAHGVHVASGASSFLKVRGLFRVAGACQAAIPSQRQRGTPAAATNDTIGGSDLADGVTLLRYRWPKRRSRWACERADCRLDR